MQEKILSIFNEAYKANYWIRLINKVSIEKVAESDRYEVKLYLSFIVTDVLGLSEFDADIDEVVKTIDRLLLPKLRKEFIAEIQEVNYFDDSVEIVLICESVV